MGGLLGRGSDLFARDASNSTIGAQNGLAHRNGLPAAEIEANFWNIDEISFDVAEADLSVTKVSSVLNDPVNGSTQPKAIPGAVIEYCILISNSGSASAEAITATDTFPANVTYTASSMRSGTSCASASTVEDDDASGADESDPFGASVSGTNLTAIAASLGPADTLALTFQVTVD